MTDQCLWHVPCEGCGVIATRRERFTDRQRHLNVTLMLNIWASSAQAMTSRPQEQSGAPRIGGAGVKAFLGTWQGEVGMGFNRYAGALLAGAAGLGMSLGATASFAADMPIKAPP